MRGCDSWEGEKEREQNSRRLLQEYHIHFGCHNFGQHDIIIVIIVNHLSRW